MGEKKKRVPHTEDRDWLGVYKRSGELNTFLSFYGVGEGSKPGLAVRQSGLTVKYTKTCQQETMPTQKM